MMLPLGLNLELGSLLLIVGGSRDPWVLAGFVALHGAASAVLAPLLWRTLPAALREPRGGTLATLFVLNLFVPTLLLWLRGAIWVGTRFATVVHAPPIGWVASPEFTSTREREGTTVRAGQIRARLTSGEAPPSARLSALLTLQDAPGRITSDILRKLLTDPFEDIRLLAYGMLDKKEKAIGQRILAAQAALQAIDAAHGPGEATRDPGEATRDPGEATRGPGEATRGPGEATRGPGDAAHGPGDAARSPSDAAHRPGDDAARDERRHRAHKRLAELQWELVWQRLVQGDLLRFTAREAWRHAHAALGIRDDDAGLWYLVGRIGLEADEPQAGRAALERAGELGFPRERLVPWLAEYAFRERRYDDVRTLFGSLATPPDALRVAAAYGYWKY